MAGTPSYRQVPPPSSMSLLPEEGDGGWGSWIPEIFWGETVQQGPLPPQTRQPAPWPGQGVDPSARQQPPPPMPQPTNAGSGTSTPWGGPEIAPSGGDPGNIVNEYTPPQKYSFLDAPGASDALVAFGASMLKAPNFNTGLGDAALAVNKVAQSYRMPTEADYARAKQLGMINRITRGKDMPGPGGVSVDRSNLYKDSEGQTWFEATGPNGEPGLYNQDTGQFSTEGVPGLTRDVYDYDSNKRRREGSKDADLVADMATKIPSIAANVVQFDELYKLAADDSTGIDSSFTTRVARQLETLLPGAGFGGMDANNITEFNNRIEKAALDYASGAFKGQGQVTENERLMIKNAVGQPGTLTKQSAMLVFRIMRDAEMRKLKMFRNWKNDPALRDQFGNDFASYQSEMLMEATLEQMNSGGGGSSPQPPRSGERRPLNDIFGN